jgi:hypothetical protein
MLHASCFILFSDGIPGSKDVGRIMKDEESDD